MGAIGVVTRVGVGIDFEMMTEADWYWYKWEAMPGQGFARSGTVIAACVRKHPEAGNCPGQVGAVGQCPVTVVKGPAAEKSPVQSHVMAPAPILGTATHAELDCMTV